MQKPTALELFTAFADQLPYFTREDLERTVALLRGRPGWERALEHARLQADAMGLSVATDSAARDSSSPTLRPFPSPELPFQSRN